jgi:hypothetical protein
MVSRGFRGLGFNEDMMKMKGVVWIFSSCFIEWKEIKRELAFV